MIELVLCLLLAAIGAAERVVSGRAWAAERTRLISIIVAQDVSPQVAVAAARPPQPEKPAPERRPTAIGL